MEMIQKARIPNHTLTVNPNISPVGNATQNQYLPNLFDSMAK